MCRRNSHPVAQHSSEVLLSTSIEPDDELEARHQFFVGMHHGIARDETQAIDAAPLPAGCALRRKFAMIDGSTALMFGPPQGRRGFPVLILEPTSTGSVRLWMADTELCRSSREEADGDVEEFSALGQGDFRVFERTPAR